MADAGDEKGSGAWSKVPTWDGAPNSWRAFQREMKWWVSSLDLESTKKYNLAARFLLRQSGIVRQRGEEFSPEELQYRPSQTVTDPESGKTMTVEEDCLFGLNKLMKALEGINGMTALDKKGELRSQFYLGTQRKAGERVSEFSTRFRTVVADLRSEQVQLPSSEVGWFYKEKLGLDPLRKQLLETALQGAEDYQTIEAETLRLFKDLHVSDPMFRAKPPLKRLFGGGPPGQGLSSASSSAGSTFSRASSNFSRPFSRGSAASSAPSRKVMVTEVPEETAEDDPELIPAESQQEADGAEPALEDLLQTQAECFAAELQEAEEMGVTGEDLEGLEQQFEQAAEALVTMKEARNRLQEIRKDRGYGRASDGKSVGKGGQMASRKASGKHACFDCGLHGHWAGDKECTMPGAGMGCKSSIAPKAKAKQVRLAEALNAEVAISSSLSSTPSPGAVEISNNHDIKTHEASVVHRLSVPLHEALLQSTHRDDQLRAASAQALTEDKLHVGALDSACNRTCCGPVWMESYITKLSQFAPSHVSALVSSTDEQERFKFGNGGLVTSSKRFRIPACVLGKVILIWISVVPVTSLGCLLGRDFLDSVGAVLNFANRTLECTFLNSHMQRLDQMAAGHFMLPLLPLRWPRLEVGSWRKCGLDNIIELKLEAADWLKRRIAEGLSGHPSFADAVDSHEHHLTESGMHASESVMILNEANIVDCDGRAQDMTASSKQQFPRQHPLLRLGARDVNGGAASSFAPCAAGSNSERCTGHRDPRTGGSENLDGRMQTSFCPVPMEKVHHENGWKTSVVRAKLAAVVGGAILLALLALSIPLCDYCAVMDPAGRGDGWAGCSSTSSPPVGLECISLHCQEPSGTSKIQGSNWLEDGIPGGFLAEQFSFDADYAWAATAFEDGSNPGDEGQGPEGSSGGGQNSTGKAVDWSSWGLAHAQGRLGEVGALGICGGGAKGHRGHIAGEDSTNCGDSQGEQDGGQIKCSDFFYACTQELSPCCQGCDAGRIHFVNMVSCESDRCGGSYAAADQRAGPEVPGHDESGYATCHEPAAAASRSDQSGNRGHQHERESLSSDDDFHIDSKQKIKPGIRQMISQAWHKHRRQQLAVSVSPKQLKQIMVAEWENEMKGYMNEAFTMELDLSPFVTEVYTDTEPIAKAAQRIGLQAGASLTLGTGWNFKEPRHREAAKRLIRRVKPYVLVIAFPCGPWSNLQYLNSNVDVQARREDAKELVLFAIELAMIQLAGNRHFLLENPLSSAAWKLEEVIGFCDRSDVMEVVIDMCRFGLKSSEGIHQKKATKLVTSSQAVVSAFWNQRCLGDHAHSYVMGGSKITTAAGHYTAEFSNAVIQAFMDQYDFEQLPDETFDPDNDGAIEVFAAESGEPDASAEMIESDGSLDGLKPNTEIAIPAAVRQAVHQLHINTGHRSRLRLARALLIAGAPPAAIEAAKQLKCSVCAERRPPKSRLPASLPPPREVGQQAHLDLVILEDSLRQQYVVAHCTDHVSRFQAARVLEDKSSAAVIHFLTVHWFPLMGPPHTLVADQGREFISAVFGDWCDSKSIYLYHIGVGAPWQNGISERSGGTLKAITGAICQTHAVGTLSEMQEAVGEAVAAYNSDPNESGVSPLQLVTGRNPRSAGDVLNNFAGRLAEHSLLEAEPSLARQVAVRETARVAMVRLHYSRGLRQAELARSRRSTAEDAPQPGDLVFFWRAQKYQSKKEMASGRPGRRLQLRRWHGPGLLVAIEGANGTGFAANCFVSFRGQLTKCPMEHVRKASSLENIAAGSWEAAIDDVLKAAQREAATRDAVPAPADEQPDMEQQSEPAPFTPALAPPALSNDEIVAALQPPGSGQPVASRRQSSMLADVASQVGSDAPDLNVAVPEQQTERGRSRLPSSTSLQSSMARARSLDAERGVKRAASEELARPARASEAGGPLDFGPMESKPAFQALTMTWEQLCNVAEAGPGIHPLLRLQAEVEMDRRAPLDNMEYDHGTWDGRWAFLCERDWELMRELGSQLPCGAADGCFDALTVQASRKEYQWTQLTPAKKALWREAAVQGWKAYVDNNAIQVLSMQESMQVRKDLARRQELDRILQPRFVLTDKHDGLRTASHPLPIKASSRIVVPGYKDKSNLEGNLRRDAPTGSRLAQHFLFSLAAFFTHWMIISADVKSAFLKGDPYLNRELYLCGVDERRNPPIPLKPGQLCRVLKGIFGLADAPREWWLRLSRSMEEHGWCRTLIDAAMWCFWIVNDAGERILEAVVVAHVDDLLFAGGKLGKASLDAIGAELGFGSCEESDFTWCGKRIRRASDGSIRLSMHEYHENLTEIILPRHRKSDPSSKLDAVETKRLRALLGSFQWLVAQVRFDMGFSVSTLQGESPPTVSTILKANSLVKEFKLTSRFELIFRAIDFRTGGIVMVSDAALGNVRRDGSNTGEPITKTYSQGCYFALLADADLVEGRQGRFNILDARSHRIARVCRSTYAAETLAAEEALDVGQLCRGFLSTMRGHDTFGRNADLAISAVKMTLTVDAKDVHDKGNSDTPSYGSQKSLAFTVAWMRSVLRKPNTSLKWTATENMWVDGGTKEMDLTHMRTIISKGTWSISYSPEFTKQVLKARSRKSPSMPISASAEIPGVAVDGNDPIMPHLHGLCEKRGWHFLAGIGLQVACAAKSFRTPEPRFSVSEFPLRTTFGRFELSPTEKVWRRLENAVAMQDLPNQHGLIGCTVPVLVTLFHKDQVPQLHANKKSEGMLSEAFGMEGT